MNQYLKNIQDLLQQNKTLNDAEKAALLKSITDADKQWSITDFKLDRTEKVKRTTAILLEETIEELEQKRKAVEAQNRELEIESSLERVRAVAMSMMKSNELLKVCEAVYNQLRLLGFSDDVLRNVLIVINNDEKGMYYGYQYSEHIGGEIAEVPYDLHPVIQRLNDKLRQSKDSFADIEISGAELHDWKSFVNSFPQKPDYRLNAASELHYYFYSVGIGALGISTFQSLSDEQLKILQRLRNVFNLSYQRYTDIQKAEAQSRESQIQLALERVRARTMAMQQSDELSETASEMFRQTQSLGLKTWSCGFNIIDKENSLIKQWVSTGDGRILPSFVTPFDEDIFQRFTRAAEKDKSFYVEEMGGEALKAHYKYMASLPEVKKLLDEFQSLEITPPDFQVFHLASFSYGYLMFITHQPAPEFYDVFKRFAAVFDQTYRRFLDLQKAEAQAREAQIELALERVRARTMAMQKSNELSETAALLYEQLYQLGNIPEQINIGIVSQKENRIEWWITEQGGKQIDTKFTTPTSGPAVLTKIYNCWKDQQKSVVIDSTGDELREWIAYQHKEGIDLNEVLIKGRRVNTVASFTNGIIAFTTPEPTSKETISVLERFASVFNQTYTRFLDLQKAEAQAREAQIQLALERVRARTMAMQHSDELQDTALLLFQQVKSLGIPPFACGFNIWDDDRKAATAWMAGEDRLQPPFKTSSSEDVFFQIHEAAQKGEQLFVAEQGGEELETHYRYMATLPAFKAVMDKMAEAGLSVPTFQIIHCAFFSQGYLMFISFDPVPEAHDIFKRFAKVFEQTYTRFLDLQKAEAQAREAQIELGLERVRARAMAMQKSGELRELISTVFIELTKLDLVLTRCVIMIYDPGSNASTWWMANSEAPNDPIGLYIKYHEYPPYLAYVNSWHERKYKFQYILEGKDKNEWDDFLFTETELSKLPRFVIEGMKAPDRVYLNASFNSFGNLTLATLEPLSNEHFDILLRFAKVFDLTYTRFNDLQKAEAQAREAQIQLALERVRAKTMAMHNSADVGETAGVMVEELKKLGIETIRCGIGIMHEPGDMEVWTINTDENNKTNIIIGWLDMNMHPLLHGAFESWRRKNESYSYELKDDDLLSYYNAINNYPGYPIRYDTASLPKLIHHNEFAFAEGTLFAFSLQQLTDEQRKIFKRFAGVFGQTYRRCLDLQKAEAQAREAQIEAALERVRSRSMGMQKSEELKAVIQIVFDQFIHLKINLDHAGFVVDYKPKSDWNFWIADPQDIPSKITHPYFDSVWAHQFNEAKEKGIDFFATNLNFEEKNKFYQDLFQYVPGLPEQSKDFYFNSPGLAASTVLLDNVGLYIENFSGIPYSDEDNKTLMRFGKAFQQTYTRFLDLQKAEAQARESRIEAVLERVRSRTMAMQKSDELTDVAGLLFEQVSALGIRTWTAGFNVWSEDNNSYVDYITSPNGGFIEPYTVLTETAEALKDISNARKSGVEFDVQYVEGEKIKQLYLALTKLDEKQYEIMLQDGVRFPSHQYEHFVFGSKVSLMFITYEPVPEAHDIFKSLGKVFEQTYTRFLDLQKAEAQAREAKIEAALERVRSKTMAMHNSQDVGETVATMFDELVRLGVETVRCGIGIMQEPNQMEVWTAKKSENEKVELIIGRLDMATHPLLQGMFNGWKNKDMTFSYELAGDDLINYFTNLINSHEYRIKYDIASLPPRQFHNDFYFPEGALFAFSAVQLSTEASQIFKRFAGVFGQTYRRYLDLQKAETQARQAHIETAMEKVRARAMAMQKPVELIEVAELLRKEMGLLGVEELETSSIYIHHEDSQKTECWYAIKDVQHPDKELVSDHMTIDLNETSVGKQMLQFYRSGKKQTSISMQGHARKEWINYCASHSKVLVGFYGDSIPDRTYHLYKFSNGYMGAASPGDISAESWDLLKRATSVFSLAYTRFSDLQQAEAQTREAMIETALERVRSRTLAMQKSDELAETAAVLFKQLILLGISPNRLYINIIKDENGEAEFWITDEDGSKVSMAYEDNLNNNPSFKKMFDGWKQQKKSLVIDMKGKELQQYFKYLSSIHVPFKGGLAQKRRLQYIAYFSKGFIGMASPDEQGEETIRLLERFAGVFNLTFTRFNDLKIAEAQAIQAEEDLIKLQTEKKRAEDALTELQVTQRQLIQSEKMASLGELTAGIAHEIQNPLNFVNNFSEVNKELLEELKVEADNGNTEEVKAIANDVIENSEKINHHGKRADAIVKGMLQHSRTTNGQKELTDINALADEYLRLAYHGLRAKEKSFNATLKTEYDESIGSINIIPQDIGRVILNLITNAFYAVDEKKKRLPENYEPTVSVSTKKIGDKVEIKVADNGYGIPQTIIDKIFQPFFTTKPTGQGTGLGLSLAYDIVKAHNGELKVETKEGEGSTFSICITN